MHSPVGHVVVLGTNKSQSEIFLTVSILEKYNEIVNLALVAASRREPTGDVLTP